MLKFFSQTKLKKLKEDFKILLVILMFSALICASVKLRTHTYGSTFYISDPTERTAANTEKGESTVITDMPNGSIKMLNINTATASEFTSIHGIGRAKAAAIVELRDEIGAFKSVDDLICVSGIGEKLLDQSREFITTK